MKPENSIFLRKRLKELREFHDLTQEQVAEISGFNYKYYQDIELGRKVDLKLSTIERLIKIYSINLHKFFSPKIPKTKLSKKISRERPHYRKSK